jgi:hypothetical protein
MGRDKFDGVIEGIRYGADGKIALARAYERRGAVWSDSLLLDRQQLLTRLKQGKRFATGERFIRMGSLLKTDLPVRLVNGSIIAGTQPADRDYLERTPVF